MSEVDEIKSAIDELVKEFKPDRVTLFGSRARGKSQPDSDYDICIVGNSDLDRRQRQLSARRLLSSYKVPVDILYYTPQEFSGALKKKHLFERNINANGKILYER